MIHHDYFRWMHNQNCKTITLGGSILKTLEKSLLISSSSDVLSPLIPSVKRFRERGCKQLSKRIQRWNHKKNHLVISVMPQVHEPALLAYIDYLFQHPYSTQQMINQTPGHITSALRHHRIGHNKSYKLQENWKRKNAGNIYNGSI